MRWRHQDRFIRYKEGTRNRNPCAAPSVKRTRSFLAFLLFRSDLKFSLIGFYFFEDKMKYIINWRIMNNLIKERDTSYFEMCNSDFIYSII